MAIEAVGPSYKIGDVVRLRSGGPMLTVGDVRQEDDHWVVMCDWFNEQGDSNSDVFRVEQLLRKK